MTKEEIKKMIDEKNLILKNIITLKQNIICMEQFNNSKSIQKQYEELQRRTRELKMEIINLKIKLAIC